MPLSRTETEPEFTFFYETGRNPTAYEILRAVTTLFKDNLTIFTIWHWIQ